MGLAAQALVCGLAQLIIDGYLPIEKAEELAAQVLDTFGQGIANPAERRGFGPARSLDRLVGR
ncbi:hypothetical protein ACFQ0M_12430 [Kitasatospora aburaviensis]